MQRFDILWHDVALPVTFIKKQYLCDCSVPKSIFCCSVLGEVYNNVEEQNIYLCVRMW